MAEATALHDWRLAPVWQRARAELAKHTRKPDQEWVRLRQQEAGPPLVCPPVASVRPELARIAVPAPTLSAYDALVEGSC